MTASTREDSSDAQGDAPEVPIAMETLRFLVGALNAGELWRWLGDRERAALRSEVTKGFKSAPGALRHGLAQARLARHLQRHLDDLGELLKLWAASQTELFDELRVLAPPATAENETQTDGEKGGAHSFDFDIQSEALSPLRARFGEAALQLAQLYLGDAPHLGDAPPEDAPREDIAPAAPESLQSEAASTRDAQDDAARQLLQRQLQETKAARDLQRKRANELAAEIAALKAHHQRELHEMRAQLVKSQKEAATQSENALAAQKNLGRETRRAKQESARLEEAEAATKSLKRQIRQLQQSAEDARKNAATATAQLQQAQETIEVLRAEIAQAAQLATQNTALPASTRKAPRAAKTPPPRAARVPIEPKKVVALPPRILDPLDETFRWNADARDFAVTLRETREMITRNEEERVFALSRALESLRESDEKTYLNFLARAREFGPYFRRVLTVSTTRVLVDASNVARIETDRRGRGKLDFLLQAREELRRRDAFPLLLIADASLQHFIDEPDEVAKMAKNGELVLLPAGNIADDFIAREARRTGAFVLTNDKSFHKQVAPDYEPSRIAFKLHHHFIEIDDF